MSEKHRGRKKVFLGIVIAIAVFVVVMAVAEFWYYPHYKASKPLFDISSQPSDDGEISVMSANVRCISPTDLGKRSWFYRADLIVKNIEQNKPDIIGFQEVTKYHYAYLNSDAYQSIFNKKAVMNELLVKTSDSSDTLVNRVSSKLLTMKAVNYVATFNNISENFRRSMGSINYVVGIILFAAAALAFVVLYNLMNINITERRRELATIKVLGFFDREVTWYIVRENIALSAIGIAAGLIGGKYLLYWLITSVEVDIVMFNRTTGISDYILAALMTAIFSVIVNIIGHMFMKSIDMVESLKTNE